MSTQYTKGGKIIAETSDGTVREGTRITTEKPDIALRAISVITMSGCPFMALGINAKETSTQLQTDDGVIHDVKKIIAEPK